MKTFVETPTLSTVDTPVFNTNESIILNRVQIDQEPQEVGFYFHDHLILKGLEAEKAYQSSFIANPLVSTE